MTPSPAFRPTVAQVDLGAVRHNVRRLIPAGAELMAVVKANGYGHGAVPVARAALEAGASWLGVALVEEGIDLRTAGISAPILVLTEFPVGSERDALACGLTASLYTPEGLARLISAAGSNGAASPIRAHVKIDTGMHRAGLAPAGAVAFVDEAIRRGIDVEGVWTHFATSEETANPFLSVQLERLGAVVSALEAAGLPRPRYVHAANTGAVLVSPATHLDLVRVGIGLYGIAPGEDLVGRGDLRPALAWRSRVAMTKRLPAGEALSYGQRYRLEREATIATVPVGYADGYSRLVAGRAHVLIGGRRFPVAGNVTMDQLLVDCGDEPVAPGDEVVLIGAQGAERITAEEFAGWMGTMGYEVVCRIGERVPRTYLGGALP